MSRDLRFSRRLQHYWSFSLLLMVCADTLHWISCFLFLRSIVCLRIHFYGSSFNVSVAFARSRVRLLLFCDDDDTSTFTHRSATSKYLFLYDFMHYTLSSKLNQMLPSFPLQPVFIFHLFHLPLAREIASSRVAFDFFVQRSNKSTQEVNSR